MCTYPTDELAELEVGLTSRSRVIDDAQAAEGVVVVVLQVLVAHDRTEAVVLNQLRGAPGRRLGLAGVPTPPTMDGRSIAHLLMTSENATAENAPATQLIT